MTPPVDDDRVLLVGFMGSGKSSVGRILARNLGWAFCDFDVEIRKRAGMSIPEIFRRHGERLFRTMEAAVGEELLKRNKVVLASGGGWPCSPGRMDALPSGTLAIWLSVSEDVLLSRVMRRKGSRPLLDVDDPAKQIHDLLKVREPWYAMAHWTLKGDDESPSELARVIQARMGIPLRPTES